ncbi:HlyD family efflux transporter periplasmic adaptor subunit [Aliiroseovarius crassostreae]|uniref:efflux RND transporter periplasmic adaptor subunit n=1 Tax=Aliiroseovarius crassostreae TaxID=154981 RepID=UPI0021FEF86D|nr:HlyD family efflux transporter periplasmic adaptor subunit [Aliiroseovarius crassostreae]UWQ01153.1 HlyD family efflux transporter periplasmic adaptor subunit [Aliiroseovarius crassostreae]
MRFLGRSLTGLFLLAATIGLLALAALQISAAFKARAEGDNARPQGRERLFAANLLPYIEARDVPILSVHGEVASRRALDVRSLAGGTVIDMADGFETGARVTEGELLLRIDPTEFMLAQELAQADVEQAEADVAEAEAALELARDELANAKRQASLREAALERQTDLVKRGVGTEAAVETAALAAASAEQAVLAKRQAVISAEARIATANTTFTRRKIQLDDTQRRLENTEIYAEISGTLADVTVLRGGVVSTNEKLARIIDPNALEVRFRLSTAQYARLLTPAGTLPRAPVKVRLDSTSGADGTDGALVATGTLARESAEVGEGQTGRLVFATLDAAAGLRPGDFVTVEVAEPALDRVARLPASSLGANGTLLLLGEGDRLEEVTVTLLRRQGNEILVRGDGLAGREVVAERTPTLGAGIRIKPRRAGGKETPEEVALSAAQITAIRAFVEQNAQMKDDAKARILQQIEAGRMPAATLERLQARMGS